MKSRKEVLTVLDILRQTHEPTMLEAYGHLEPYKLVIMTLLSARAKDSTTIPVALGLFESYPTLESLAAADINDIERHIFKIGFYRAKARYVKELCNQLLERFGGVVPQTLEELTSLPGVGRKTANCVLAYAFSKPAIAVDIHVHRITNSGRLAWINTKTVEESEKALCKLLPKDRWIDINQLIVDHGQRICLPVRPKCSGCSIVKYCQFEKR